jgi:hypothetical protein
MIRMIQRIDTEESPFVGRFLSERQRPWDENGYAARSGREA